MSDSVLMVASAQAGSTDEASLAAAVAALASTHEVEIVETSEPGQLDLTLDRLEGRTLVVAGGDGSLHTVVAALHRRRQLHGTDLALVPLGTGNDFAHTVGIPLDPAEAAGRIGTVAPRPLDLLVDDSGDIVVNVVHAGIGADAADRAAGLKPVLGAAAYPLGAVLAGASNSGWDLSVDVDGSTVHEGAPVLMVAVCNGRTIGGGTPLAPLADPGDGLADIVVVTAVDLTARVSFGADLRKGEHLLREDVRQLRGRSVTVRGEASYNSDGEIGAPTMSKTFTLVPAAWSLRC